MKLKQISERVGGHKNYFSHHSSVDKEVREYVEFFAKNSTLENFCISCTSTLELGIDIGNVDEVVQIDATHSIASLIQRVGRSGRREGKASNLFLYATDKWSLLQSLACWLLYQEQYIEPISINERPYDVLVHQILSIVKGTSGISLSKLLEDITTNSVFIKIKREEAEEIITHLITLDFLEKLGNELIIGIEGEEVVNSRDFYSLFETQVFFKVSSNGVKIGELPLSPQIRENENIYLSAKIWSIIDIDFKTKKIEVIPAKDGKKPTFFGDAADTAHRIREKMLEILITKETYDFLDDMSREALNDLRKEFCVFTLNDFKTERPLLVSNEHLTFYSFTSSKINRTLQFILNLSEVKSILHDEESLFEIENSDGSKFITILNDINRNQNIDQELINLLENTPEMIDFSKWGKYLPIQYQAALLKEKYFDFEGCYTYIQQLKCIENKLERSN
ncbi:helicase-related protein [Chryseobacterium tructae]|uniref:helicase-related protein n=1 Tax=Chryseobacterium tructae TaxID=1037380 RepID=UPI0025B29ED6|nr:helicase-related protein [Chryseobacterium tructae]MDN3693196.1 helicase-related protein [Chryseobacterium tructae]